MTTNDPGRTDERVSRLVPLLFFLSGAAALIEEVSWSRQVGLVVGMTARSGAVVLGSYFAGLALGYLLASRLTSRLPGLRGYGWAEMAAAGLSALVPLLLWGVDAVDALQAVPSDAWRVVGSALAILPASIALGATWPFMATWARSPEDPGRLARAYAMNTAGAAIGVVLATSVLLLYLGVKASNGLASLLSLGCGLAALVLSRGEPRPLIERAEASTSMTGEVGWAAVAALSGFGLLALQVLSARMFALVFHNSAYTFGLVTAVFLAALALGSFLSARLGERASGIARPARAAAVGALAVPIAVLGFIWGTGLRYQSIGTTFGGYLMAAGCLVAVVLTAPVALLGMVLPGCWTSATAGLDAAATGARVGRLTAWNAAGGAAGAMTAGFVFLPRLGLWWSIGLVALLFALFPVVRLALGGRFMEAAGLAAMVVGLARFLVATGGSVPTLPEGSDAQILASWDGAYGRVEVIERQSGMRILRQDLHYGLGSSGDAGPRESRQGHIPLLLHPNPRRVAFLGLGTGLTAASALMHPEVKRVDVVELVPEVALASRYFEEENRHLLDDPRVELQLDDARHHLNRVSEAYDVIVSDLYVPWESRAGYLYTSEFYGLARSRLAPGGIFCQWLPLYQLGAEDVNLVLDTFASRFPHRSLWWGRLSAFGSILAMVGSDRPILFEGEQIGRRLGPLRDSFEKDDAYLGTWEEMERLQATWRGEPALSFLNTDEHPRLEFLAPIDHAAGRLLTGERLLEFFDERLSPVESAWRAWQRRMILTDEGRALGGSGLSPANRGR